MSRVDFYLLQSRTPNAKLNVACRLANKVYQSGMTGLIRVPDAATAKQLDDLLWTYDQSSFIPHSLDDDLPRPGRPPIVISHLSQCDYDRDVLISLLEQVPEDHAHFDRIAEVVGAEAEEKARARDRYRFYRDQGCQLETHEMSA